MLSEAEAREFAIRWVRAWNSHDIDAILSHYAQEAILTSPAAGQLVSDSFGTIRGKEALREYFLRGLHAYPSLSFQLLDVMRGVNSLVLCFINHKGTKTAEFMEFDANQKVVRIVANYT